MINVAILGFGVVGGGVGKILQDGTINKKLGQEVNLTRILCRKTLPHPPFDTLATHNFDDILNDDQISIVVETIGGLNPAYDYTKRALEHGKSVITSNKELVATHGVELMALAKKLGVSYMFEASVGGGVPIIRPLVQCLAADEITQIMGILNGTTNYILTKMISDDKTFAEALSEAQAKGYAESDPTADVEGHDTCRKISILSSLCYGRQVDYKNIPTVGISNVSLDDIKAAMSRGSTIKLVGISKRNDDGTISAEVKPMELPSSHPLSGVDDVYNAILVTGSITGDVMFYGRGAGRYPTASAVIADIVDVVKNGNRNAPSWK
ncbi:MAG: homoserine dehydrogenase [Clostridiales bacterium]|nr:homoserine dehydrogenase [Clostridiales bacterium]